MKRIAFFIFLLSVLTSSKADPLKPDSWSEARQAMFIKWLFQAGDATRPCSIPSAKLLPNGARQLKAICRVSPKSGKPEQRERKLKLQIAGATWNGQLIKSIEYEQQYLFDADVVVHAALRYELADDSDQLVEKFKEWWRERGLTPIRDNENIKDMVQREAGLEWVERIGRVTRFASEFYE